jgi:hypothetical protein
MKRLTPRENAVQIFVLSSLFVFAARLLQYGFMGIIAPYEWPIPFAAVTLPQVWLGMRIKVKFKLQYAIPIILICLMIFRFSVSFSDQAISLVGKDYSAIVNPGAFWIARNVNSGSVVSSNQASALLFSAIAESNKANMISMNEFGSDVKSLSENVSYMHNLFLLRGYNYLLLLKVFESQPVAGGFWGPYVQPLGYKTNSLNNASLFTRIYDDGMSALYKIN